ncbi:hypothetical protein F4801DRAFT_577088 [Xylaria longipes]|nr:hypothetical protein F4801DRAFT_577088 [Xylaria longipes]
MNYDPISHLGLSCPSGGNFYICQDSEVQFLGCCDVDPCSSECPSSALHPASFEADRYNDIPAQSCVGSTSPSLWYTCTNGQTFLGCCTSVPCDNEGVCPEDNLVGARLADDPSSASVFLTATTAGTATSAASAPPSTDGMTSAPASTAIITTQIPSPTPNTASKGSSPTPTTEIVGGILGGLIGLILVAFVFFQYRRRRRELVTTQSDEDVLQPPWSPYHDSFRGSPTVPPAPGSPLYTASRRHKSPSLSSIIGFKRVSNSRNHFLLVLATFRAQAFLFGTRECLEDSETLLNHTRNGDN